MRDLTDYMSSMGLVETQEKELERPLYRRPGFDGIVSFADIDAKLSEFLAERRESTGLSRPDFARLFGVSRTVYARYERDISRLSVARMIHLSELLGFLPMEMISAAAPHLYGPTRQEAEDRLELCRLVADLPNDTVRNLIGIIGQLTPREVIEARAKSQAQKEEQDAQEAEAERLRNIKKAKRAAGTKRRGRPPGKTSSKRKTADPEGDAAAITHRSHPDDSGLPE